MSPRLPRTALSALALVVLAGPLHADSDGYYCASPGVLAWQVAFSGGPDGLPPRDRDGRPAHRLYILRYGPGVGISRPTSVDLPSFQSHGMRCGQDTVHVAGWEAVHAVALSGPGAPRIAEVRAHPPGEVPEGYHEQSNLGRWYRGPWDAGRAWIPLPAPSGSQATWRIGLALDVSVRCRDMPLRSWIEERTEAGELAAVQPLLTGSVPTQCEREPDPALAIGLLRADGIVAPVGRLLPSVGLRPLALEREPLERWYADSDTGVVALEGGEVVEVDHPYVPRGQRIDDADVTERPDSRIRAVVLGEPRPLLRMLPADTADPAAGPLLAWLDTVHAEWEARLLVGETASWFLGRGVPADPAERRAAPLRLEALAVSETPVEGSRYWSVHVERRYPPTGGEDPECPLRSVLLGFARTEAGRAELIDAGGTLTDCDGKELAWTEIHALLPHESGLIAIGEARDWDGGTPAAWRVAGDRLVRQISASGPPPR